jgi:hypothetical protein
LIKQPWTWWPYPVANPHTKHTDVSVHSDETVGEMELAWGKKVSKAFKEKVVGIAAHVGTDPHFLMAAMAVETARTFSPSIRNPKSGATGLIQFTASTAEGMGTSTDALGKMGALEQLDWVEAYFRPYVGKLRGLDDLYMAILWPRAIGKPASFVLFAQPTTEYAHNRSLDANDDGTITKAEAARRVRQHLVQGMRVELRG